MRNWLHGLILTLGLSWLFLAAMLLSSLQFERQVQGAVREQGAEAVERAAQAATGSLAPLFTPEVRYWEKAILRWAAEHELDPNLVATVMQIESCGHPTVASHAGAVGLFQVMPYHFQPGEDPRDPETNARRGLAYLRQAWEKTGGNVRFTLAAYNGGFKRLQEPETLWPAETQRYVAWGTAIYQDAVQGKSHSPTLEAWLSRGGWSLCLRARMALALSE